MGFSSSEGHHGVANLLHAHQASAGRLDFEETMMPKVESYAAFGATMNGPATAQMDDPLKGLSTVVRRSRRWIRQFNHILFGQNILPRGRHWSRCLRYVTVGCICWRLVSRHSFSEMQEWTLNMGDTAYQVFQLYCVVPAVGVWDALTVKRFPSEVRRAALSEEVASLARMVVDYHDHNFQQMTTEERLAVKEAADREDLGAVNTHYEKAIQQPIRSALIGNLFRIMLIQLQKQRVDIDRVLLTSEEVLEQNDLNFKMMSLAPMMMLLAGGCYYYYFARRRHSQAPMHRRMRRCWRSVHRIISKGEASDTEGVNGEDVGANIGAATGALSLSMLEEGAHGSVLLLVHEMRMLTSTLGVDAECQQHAMEDLDDLENTEASRAQRLRTLQRMYQSYWFLHPRPE